MIIKDVLLAMSSHPAPTKIGSIEASVGMAARLGAHLSGVAFALDIRSPVGLYADPLNVRGMLAAQSRKSAEAAKDLVAAFDNCASRRGVPHEHLLEECAPKDIADLLIGQARLYDLTIMPIGTGEERQSLVEALVFGAGRPVLLLPESSSRDLPDGFDTVMVAWDHSRPAARAVADAMPLLQAAKRVRVVTAVNEKALARPHSGVELSKHLARHGANVVFETVESKGRAIGDVLEADAVAHGVDLLVMGVYGHSRLREFVLGGATRSVLSRPFVWTLVSH